MIYANVTYFILAVLTSTSLFRAYADADEYVARVELFLQHFNTTPHFASLETVSPILKLAIEDIEKRGILPAPYSIKIHENGFRSCFDVSTVLLGVVNAINGTHGPPVDCFFGPPCDYVLVQLSRFGRVWKKPAITIGGFAFSFDHKRTIGDESDADLHPNVVRMSGYRHKELLMDLMPAVLQSLHLTRLKVLSVALYDDQSVYDDRREIHDTTFNVVVIDGGVMILMSNWTLINMSLSGNRMEMPVSKPLEERLEYYSRMLRRYVGNQWTVRVHDSRLFCPLKHCFGSQFDGWPVAVYVSGRSPLTAWSRNSFIIYLFGRKHQIVHDGRMIVCPEFNYQVCKALYSNICLCRCLTLCLVCGM